ncbi:MAG TPA: lipopolysaccharide core heptose(I) kinase RfaP [Candidatus Dormibacteraeota bacterium]|nr:lipopolysaccharide core heptose(I) kinase RfaP [Candidatus Dormibacteraeota bacterium]
MSPHLQQHLPKENTFDWVLDCPGKVHRHIKHRRTIETEIGGRRFFIKVHRACGWREVWKDWLQGRAPVVSARTEWEALERVERLGIPTTSVAGKGERGNAPAHQESFLVTEALDDMIHLEDLTRDWGGLKGSRQKLLKRALLLQIARIARTLHGAGMNHRDFYLGHFLVKNRRWTDWMPGDPLELHLIDLHRVQIHHRLPQRSRVKDLGGLLFSALDCGLTRGDVLRFIRIYSGRSWRESLVADANLWRRVWRYARQLYTRHRRGRPVPELGLARF